MPTLTQLANLESLALTALQKVLTTTDNPHIIVRAANAILRYCKSSLTPREEAGGKAMSSTPTKISTPTPSPDPFTNVLTKHEVAQLRHLLPTLPMNQILDPKLVKRWRAAIQRCGTG